MTVMALFRGSYIAVLLLLAISISGVNSKALCFAGSTGFSLSTNDCSAKDPSYTGTWYCSKVEVCEKFLEVSPLKGRGGRDCTTSRGCAFAEECINKETGLAYNGEQILSNSVMPGGMKIRPYCCAADNTGANEYKLPCNTASPGIMRSSLVLILALGAAFYTALS